MNSILDLIKILILIKWLNSVLCRPLSLKLKSRISSNQILTLHSWLDENISTWTKNDKFWSERSHKISRNLSRHNYVNNLLKPSGWTKWTTRGPRILDNLVRTHFLTRFGLCCFIFQVLFTSWRAGKKSKSKISRVASIVQYRLY